MLVSFDILAVDQLIGGAIGPVATVPGNCDNAWPDSFGDFNLADHWHFLTVTDEFISLYGKGVTLGVDPEYVYQSNSRTNLPDGAIVLIGSDSLWEMESGVDESSCKKCSPIW